MIKTGWLGA